jgi:hypothetical protein
MDTDGVSGHERHELDRLLDDLARWAGDSGAVEAAGARSRGRWLRRQAQEEATFAGLALDLLERGAVVVLRTTAGRAHRGRIVAVARDFWLLRTETRAMTFVATSAIASVRAQPGERAQPAPDAAGARPVALRTSMSDVLADLAADHPHVKVVLPGEPDPIGGQLRSVGTDVVTLRVAAEPPATVYVRLGSVSELSVLGSG